MAIILPLDVDGTFAKRDNAGDHAGMKGPRGKGLARLSGAGENSPSETTASMARTGSISPRSVIAGKDEDDDDDLDTPTVPSLMDELEEQAADFAFEERFLQAAVQWRQLHHHGLLMSFKGLQVGLEATKLLCCLH